MNASEKLCLQWNDFEKNITSSFKELKDDTEFTDVTLACEDGQQIEAHKVVLALASPFFMDILKKNKHPHPLIYLRGLKSLDLVAIIDFLYHGETNVFQENLDTFLALAEELRLKGLTGGAEAEKEVEKETLQSRKMPTIKKEMSRKMTPLSEPNFEGSTMEEYSNETTVALTRDKISIDLQELDEQIKSMITKSGVSTNNGQGRMATCNACGKQGALKHMPQHIEANHIIGISHASSNTSNPSVSSPPLVAPHPPLEKLGWHQLEKELAQKFVCHQLEKALAQKFEISSHWHRNLRSVLVF